MNRTKTMVLSAGIGAGVGASLMFLLDPARGRARRARIGEKAGAVARRAQDAAGRVARDLENRAQGIAAEMRRAVESEPVSDEVLVERVRAKLGRIISHPHALEVTARNGVVTLTGHLPPDEGARLISCAENVSGVCSVENRLTAEPAPVGSQQS